MSENSSIPPVACTLDEDRAEEREAQVRSGLLPKYEGAKEHGDGYTLQFAGTDDTILAVAQFVADELQCCSFADYQISVSPPHEETRLTITGPEGTKAMFGEGFVDRLEDETL